VSPPLVSCILTVYSSVRIALARKAVNNFIRQHYLPYELLIVNSTGQSILTNDDMNSEEIKSAGCHVREVTTTAVLNAAGMKNIGLSEAKGDWVICIDDDDYFHPMRLMYQMAHRHDSACMLKYQLRMDISQAVQVSAEEGIANQTVKPLLHLLKMDSGIPCTMLFPRLGPNGAPWKFDENLNIGEYTELLARMKQVGEPVVCDNMHNVFNSGLQWPLLSLAVYHGSNELSYEDFFAKFDPLANPNGVPLGINQEDIDHLKVVLYSYNFRVA
jgi:glycosyltransferase involved in cell wall biosynthesis